MARRLNILTAIAVRNASKPGLAADGGGLYLQVGPTGGKSWLFRFMLKGKARAMGLGPLHTISLAEARQTALECRKALFEGKDPIEERNSRLTVSGPDAQPTFEWCADAHINAHAPGWLNKKHAEQ